MKVIAHDICRLTVLFPFEEVAPLEGATRTLMDEVGARYKFSKLPDPLQTRADIDKNGLKFEAGDFEGKYIAEFTVFGDGVVIAGRTTEDAEDFWNDISAWLQSEKGFRPFSTPPQLRYISQLIVEFDRPVSNLVKSFQEITKLFSDALSAVYGQRVPIGFARIDFEFDKIGSQSALIVPKIIMERRVQIAHDRERYMCGAPIKTATHIAILEHIERLLG